MMDGLNLKTTAGRFTAVLILWPLFWGLGMDFIAPTLFVLMEGVRLWRTRPHRIHDRTLAGFGLAMAVVWVLPMMHLPPRSGLLFVRQLGVGLTMAGFILVLAMQSWSDADRRGVMRGFGVLGLMNVAAGLGYVLPFGRLNLITPFGWWLPARLVHKSVFWHSVAVHAFGQPAVTSGGLAYRIRGLAVTPAGLSFFLCLWIPFVGFRIITTRGWRRGAWSAVLTASGALVWLNGTRMLYPALAASLLVFLYGLTRSWPSPIGALRVRWVVMAGLIAVLGLELAGGTVSALTYRTFFESRPSSARVRGRILHETLVRWKAHPIVGRGVPMRIRGQGKKYSAGTHSMVLMMLFQHGLLGIGLYLAFWGTLWRRLVRRLRSPAGTAHHGTAWMTAVALVGFHVRELTGTWMWDPLPLLSIWTFLVLLSCMHDSKNNTLDHKAHGMIGHPHVDPHGWHK